MIFTTMLKINPVGGIFAPNQIAFSGTVTNPGISVSVIIEPIVSIANPVLRSAPGLPGPQYQNVTANQPPGNTGWKVNFTPPAAPPGLAYSGDYLLTAITTLEGQYKSYATVVPPVLPVPPPATVLAPASTVKITTTHFAAKKISLSGTAPTPGSPLACILTPINFDGTTRTAAGLPFPQIKDVHADGSGKWSVDFTPHPHHSDYSGLYELTVFSHTEGSDLSVGSVP